LIFPLRAVKKHDTSILIRYPSTPQQKCVKCFVVNCMHNIQCTTKFLWFLWWSSRIKQKQTCEDTDAAPAQTVIRILWSVCSFQSKRALWPMRLDFYVGNGNINNFRARTKRCASYRRLWELHMIVRTKNQNNFTSGMLTRIWACPFPPALMSAYTREVWV